MAISDSELRGVIDVETGRDTAPFRDAAAAIITEHFSGSGYSAGYQKQIELYLAAHFAAITVERGGLRAVQMLDTREVYGGDFTKHLDLTRYGQTAVALDTAGILTRLNKRPARFTVVESYTPDV